MARTKDEIFNNMIARKDADSVLSAVLTSNSKASFYQSLFAVFADEVGDFELTFDAFEARVQSLLDSRQVQTESWWRRVSLAFQLGDALTVFDNGNVGYATINTANQIVKRAAIISAPNAPLALKVAKLGSDGVTPTPLTSSERTSFSAYINDVQPAGLTVDITSEEGDEVQLTMSVLVDSQVIDPDNGDLLSDRSIKPAERGIMNYFATFQNESFGGAFYANKLLQSILAETGIINATFDSLEKKAFTETAFSDVLAMQGRFFATFAGYVKIANGFDLSSNITYSGE